MSKFWRCVGPEKLQMGLLRRITLIFAYEQDCTGMTVLEASVLQISTIEKMSNFVKLLTPEVVKSSKESYGGGSF